MEKLADKTTSPETEIKLNNYSFEKRDEILNDSTRRINESVANVNLNDSNSRQDTDISNKTLNNPVDKHSIETKNLSSNSAPTLDINNFNKAPVFKISAN